MSFSYSLLVTKKTEWHRPGHSTVVNPDFSRRAKTVKICLKSVTDSSNLMHLTNSKINIV